MQFRQPPTSINLFLLANYRTLQLFDWHQTIQVSDVGTVKHGSSYMEVEPTTL